MHENTLIDLEEPTHSYVDDEAPTRLKFSASENATISIMRDIYTTLEEGRANGFAEPRPADRFLAVDIKNNIMESTFRDSAGNLLNSEGHAGVFENGVLKNFQEPGTLGFEEVQNHEQSHLNFKDHPEYLREQQSLAQTGRCLAEARRTCLHR